MVRMWIFFALAGLLAAIVLIIMYTVYRKVFFNSKKNRSTDPYAGLSSPYLEGMREIVRQQIDDLSMYPCEEIRIRSKDGKTLFGRYYKGRDDSPICILFHGYKGSSYTELSGAALMMLSHGLGAIVVDHRAHGKSGGRTVSFGIKERFDCLLWANYVKERFGEDKKIVFYGISMGASTVIMSSALDLPRGVCAIIADCPYSEPSAIIKRVLKNRGLSPKKVYPIVFLSAMIFGRFNLGASSPYVAVKGAKAPILLIHGSADDFVPHTMSEDIYNSNTKASTLFTVEGAKHGGSFAVGQEHYVKEVLSFIDEKAR